MRGKIPKNQKVVVRLVLVVKVHCVVISRWKCLLTVLNNFLVWNYPSPPRFKIWDSVLKNGDVDVVDVGHVGNVEVRFDIGN